MNRIKRITAVILCFLMLFLCACDGGKQPTSSSPAPTPGSTTAYADDLSIFYCSKDSLNPYAAVTEFNLKLQTLMYDPLVRLTPEFQPELVIAENIELAGKTCTVTLKNVTFSDGSALTADDVVYSLKLAKESTLIYADQLSNITGYRARDGKVVITLSKADPYFVNLLDFPIIKARSETLTDENKIILPPIGSGRYVFDRDNKYLYANESHVLGAPNVKRILLIDAPDSEVTKFNLESGNVSIYNTDLSTGEVPSMIGTITLSPLNNFVYLGVNLNRDVFSDAKMRYAVSYAINRAAICDQAYFSYALPASGLFSPLWQDAKGLQNIPSTENLQNSIANLAELGYNSKDNEGFFVGNNGKRLSLTLVCNSDNERRMSAANLIKTQLEAAGIAVAVKALEWDGYVAALASGDFDLYIAEIRLLNNMDVTELVTSNGSLSYGIPDKAAGTADKPDAAPADDQAATGADGTPDGEGAAQPQAPEATAPVVINQMVDDAVSGFYGEDLSLIDIINAFNAEMPIIPICYRSGITFCNSKVSIENMSSVTDAYYNITNTKLK